MSHLKITAENVTYSYPDGHEAIAGVSFSVCQGQSVGLIGANGAGKSTLLSLITGVIMPVSGHIALDDFHVTPKTLPEVRRRLGMIFQDPDDQLFMGTVYDDVAFGPRNFDLEENEVEKRVFGALDLVNSRHLADRAPFRLSGGEKRAVAIAGVLAMHPDALIMDEPTAELDPLARDHISEILKKFDHTKLIASHDLDLILEICDRVLLLKDGRLIADGPAAEILSDAALLESSGLRLPLSLRNCPVCGRAKNTTR